MTRNRIWFNDTFQVNVLPARLHPALGFRDYTALGLFMSSWVFEVTADYQKGAWRKARDSKQHDEKYDVFADNRIH